ncbi:MAG: four helix bundle protein [Candidatus Hydrogenedentota bacterium]
MIKSYKDLEVYKKSYELAMRIWMITKKFPKEEIYSLSSQILRSSRSIPANIAEGWAKRNYENIFKKHLLDAIGSCDETRVWLDFAFDSKYLTNVEYKDLINNYDEIGKMLNGLKFKWKTFK